MDSNTVLLAKASKANNPTASAQPTTPSKMLDLTIQSPSTTAISARNKQNSPLLALPSEILSDILRYVVADKVVHVLPEDGDTVKTRVCLSPEDCPNPDSPRAKIAHEDNTVSDGMEDDTCFTTRHQECSDDDYTVDAKQGLSLDVMLVCRQIYKEASLLPFQENEFVFGLKPKPDCPPPTMDRWIDRLRPEQRDVVRHVTVVSSACVSTDKVQLARFTGLRTLRLLLAPGNEPAALYEEVHNTWRFAHRYAQKWQSLRDFRITFEAYYDSKSYDVLYKQTRELTRLVRHMEARTTRWNSECAKAKVQLATEEDIKVQEDEDALLDCLMALDAKRGY